MKELFKTTEKWIEELANYMVSLFWDISKYKIKNYKTISSIFLAWAPWSWKTEFFETIFKDLKETFIIIDIDKYRCLFEWYNWENSSEYQNASVRVADKLLSYCFKNNLNFAFDWTFRNYNKVKQNFWQCEKYKRHSLITLIFQEPRISFYYTFLRKLEKKRNVPIDVFVDWFYGSIFNVFKAIREFKNVNLMIANKKYNPLNKNKYGYVMDYKTDNLKDFCNEHMILYKKWEFLNKKNLELDLERFQDILMTQFFWEKKSIFWKMKIWFLEKIYKWY